MSGIKLHRLGVVMEPEPGNLLEAEGVLNPAAARGPDGALYLFPRLVAAGNYSRIGIARVLFNEAGDPVGVERLGIVLEPEADYERHPNGGGCEDPRISFVKHLQCYIMSYTAFSSLGPRIALARSTDLLHWQRLGLVNFAPCGDLEFNRLDNKDASFFPIAVLNPSGEPELALLHRPFFAGNHPEETACQPSVREVDLDRESIWISYGPKGWNGSESHGLCQFSSHHRLASPVAPWERLKIGGGTPPVLSRHGWLIVYHGVSEILEGAGDGHSLSYAAGLMVLSKEDPSVIRYRSPEPVLEPVLSQERYGIVANVVFPTGIDVRDDIGFPNRFDIYYGMADQRIGVARLDLPERLPSEGAVADSLKTQV